MEQDCCFIKENRWFRYRAAAIIIEEGCVLFVGNQREDYLYSVGGGVHMGETAEEAVKREVYEETGVAYEIDRLAIIHENFFKGDGTLEGLQCHEVALYYLMKPRGTKELHSNSYTGGVKEEMHWIPIEELVQQAIEKMEKQGIHQWDDLYPTKEDFEEDEEYAYVVHRLCVRPSFQRCGIAKQTLSRIEEQVREQNGQSIRLDVFSENPFSMRLYTSCGYQKTGETTWRKGVFYFMEKCLA